jgi:spermidine synthase
MVASGFAGLSYQIVWTQQSTLWLGHESAAVLAVVAAFFGGLALGALALGTRIDRSPKPARWYAACEIAIALWAVVLAVLFPHIAHTLLKLIGVQPSPAWHWFVAFTGTFLFLLPATAAMGATLPAMERVVASLHRQGAAIAPLYAANTFGAVAGVLIAAFVLIPTLGLVRTACVCAVLNLLCALGALSLPTDVAKPNSNDAHIALSLLAATGVLGIGYEVVVVRILSQVAENTVYTFALLLAVYLVGTALGAAAYGRWRSNDRTSLKDRDVLLRAMTAVCLAGALSLAHAEIIKASILETLGTGMPAALVAEAVLAIAAFLLPTVVMGALFSHLATSACERGASFGRALGVNTLGAAFAPLLFGVLLIPALGLSVALVLIAAGYLLLTSGRAWFSFAQWATVGATALFVVWVPTLAIVDIPEGGRLVSQTVGATATVSVVEDARGVATLHIDNRQQEGSSATRLADARQALLPILLQAGAGDALFLGLGTGVSAASATADPAVHVDAVELLPEVIAASVHFIPAGDAGSARLHVMTADARRFVRATQARYDVIVSDNFHPARGGSGALYTVEHFRAVKQRLAAGGLFCQWVPLHQLDLETLRTIVQSFLTVYPHSSAILATNSLDTPVVGLVAREDGGPFDLEAVRRRLAPGILSRRAAELGLTDDVALFGSFIAGAKALARFAGDAPVNTDDRPVVAYRAPRITYAPDSRPRDRLIALLHALAVTPDEVIESHDDAWQSRLAAYWSARDRFIEAGRDVDPTRGVERMLSQVRGPLLTVLHISPEFRPAYDPLLRMAEDLSASDLSAARALLIELQQVQPSRTEAAEALRALEARSN